MNNNAYFYNNVANFSLNLAVTLYYSICQGHSTISGTYIVFYGY